MRIALHVPGRVGRKHAAGQVVLTSTGSQTTPFPKVDLSSEKKSANTQARVDRWLLENAIAEAEARRDDYNCRIFRAERPKNLPAASKDSAECYLFDPSFIFPANG